MLPPSKSNVPLPLLPILDDAANDTVLPPVMVTIPLLDALLPILRLYAVNELPFWIVRLPDVLALLPSVMEWATPDAPWDTPRTVPTEGDGVVGDRVVGDRVSIMTLAVLDGIVLAAVPLGKSQLAASVQSWLAPAQSSVEDCADARST
ncbi:hypothetical protein C5748_23980 [Phyllobacterium phragmitis]|uniref:Uncharacterized protein n=1 Tax=Phyllobacterium phragmitis TaxID=2670329 RepID=A0A2S9IKI6_9HYPH|nr:hypothetical protein C5748_23980 [Phyllobacterium phragmitis]